MCDWRKLPRRVTSRPEIEISDKRLAFSSQTSSIEPSYKTGPKQVKMSISQKVQGFLKIFRVQNVALTVRRPKHPSLVWCIGIFLYETFSRLIPRDSNTAIRDTIWWYGRVHSGTATPVEDRVLLDLQNPNLKTSEASGVLNLVHVITPSENNSQVYAYSMEDPHVNNGGTVRARVPLPYPDTCRHVLGYTRPCTRVLLEA